VIGTREVQPPDVSVPRPFKSVTIRFGRPVAVERYADRPDDRFVLRQITDEVMFEIRELTGQEYDPTYATRPSGGSTDAPPDVAPEVSERRSSAEVLGAGVG
jgi:1-acyl-sn-glycerol-3-phosphate acyltransferase